MGLGVSEVWVRGFRIWRTQGVYWVLYCRVYKLSGSEPNGNTHEWKGHIEFLGFASALSSQVLF